MDRETKTITNDLYSRHFELLCLQVTLSSRINTLKEMFQYVLETTSAEFNPNTSLEKVIAEIEAQQLELILKGYADEDPGLASAIEARLKQEA